jgi:ABC-type polysaccharide/polyol phosphate transport system ATPase subunit
MERIIIENLSKQFRIGAEKKLSALGRIFEAISGKSPTKTILAIDDVSLTVGAGELVGIIGKNGSGKSTLLRLVAGIYRPSSGRIETHGKIISLINLYIGLKQRLTMRDNIYLIGSLLGMGRKDIKKKFDDMVGFAELHRFVNTKISQFSMGMTQRLVFSIAINADPEILLLDEIFEVGDEGFKKKSADKIRELVRQGVTVVLVSHELDLIKKYCDKAILMDNGKIADKGNSKQIIENYLRNYND